ncbi:MAG: alpha/beta fold hydrolase, partial [Chloroflexi bacterium]|nr:alpha/beta fold hydrolase [Chloroflexota bacterium]
MHFEANGIKIHYRVDGREGAPWVTFINGIANDTTMWDGQVPALEGDFRILRYDARGHGGTQATEGDYTFDMLIGDLLGLWDALDIRKSHLIGLGLGGSTALGAAIEHSDRLLSLVPCACRADMAPDLA